MINPTKLVFLMWNSHFLIITSIFSLYSLFKTYFTYFLCSFSLYKYIIILSKYIIIICSCLTSNAVLFASPCRLLPWYRYKKPPRRTWVVIQSVPLQVARPYYVNGRKNTFLGRCSETPVQGCPSYLSCPVCLMYHTSC